MAEEKTYLEFSEPDGGSHKFYEVTIKDTEVTIRYGRIGDQGQSSTSKYPTPEKAKAEAQKKINEKLRKGYEQAVMGVRQKRKITQRTAQMDPTELARIQAERQQRRQGQTQSSSTASPARTSKPKKVTLTAPVVWEFDSGSSALGIFIDDGLCWVGNQAGKVYALKHTGEIFTTFKLPDGVKAIVADDEWLYAGCDDGNVYDLSGKAPRLAYQISDDVDIFWIDIKDGILAISDAEGTISVVNHEDESQWTKKSRGDMGWMVRCDEIGVYHGHSKGVTMYDWEDGSEIWSHPTDGWIGFGWQEETVVYACTSNGKVHSFTKKGEVSTVYHCDAFLCSCAAAEKGKYVFAGDTYGMIYCFDQEGNRLWKLSSGCGAAQSMQYFKGHLYIVTNLGILSCIDVSEAAIEAAKTGTVTAVKAIEAPQMEQAATVATALETTSDTSQGVMVECYREGGTLRVRVVSPGYNQSWHCQFPKDIREAGARFMVDEVREAVRGGFYRVLGNIRKLA